MSLKKNNSNNYDNFFISLDETKYPIAFKAKLDELVKCGMTETSARKLISESPIEMEIYYSPDQGLFAVEAEAVDNSLIFNPYDGEEMEENDE